jgi:hypothetical protein
MIGYTDNLNIHILYVLNRFLEIVFYQINQHSTDLLI